ncbi:hypothetical protein RhiirC2_844410 [Rhizophagus irregularis]|uniref:Uncharacterized protein n=1 Tax=Rhizophagus irregularis TaxID=588596 RepID=A0A2N1NTV2_9GLOM|nr:hypothetical protein RhiirC2_844410 [Rhizophagus irregularis]
MDNDDNKNNNNKTSGKRSLDFNNLKRPKPTTTRSTRSTRLSTSMNIEINEQNNLKDTEANHQTISDTSQIETPKKTKIARLDLFRDRDIDEIIISTNKTTKGSSQAINESSTISSYIPSVVISPPSFSPPSSIKTTISDKAASGGKAASDKAASGGKAASGKASGKAASSSSKSSSSSVKAVISKESPSDNNATTSSSKVMDQAVSSGEFAKLIQINQKTASKLNTIINNQERFEVC